MSIQDDMARQQAAGANQLSNLGGLANAAPRPPTNLEEATQKVHRLIENCGGIINRNAQFIDRINGARPETDKCVAEQGGASGQLSELHRLLDIVDGQVREMASQIDTIDGTV